MTPLRLPDRKTQVRFLRFFTVGGTAFVVNIACFPLFKHVLPIYPAFTIAYVLSVATHYSLNRFWALPSTRTDTGWQFVEYLGTTLLSYLVSFYVFKFSNSVLGFGPGLVSQLISIPPGTLAGGLILNYWVFRQEPPGPKPPA